MKAAGIWNGHLVQGAPNDGVAYQLSFGGAAGNYCREMKATRCGLTIPVTTGVSTPVSNCRVPTKPPLSLAEYGEPARKAFARVFISATRFQ